MWVELSYLLLTIVNFLLACLILTFLGKRLGIHESQQAGFSSSLEVLRGMAAFLVFGAHSTMYFGLAPKQVMAASMGELGVLLFFMLTGHLFWSQIKAGKYDGNSFFIKRIRRLVPIMLVVIATFSFLDWIMGGLPIPTVQQLVSLFRNFGFGFGKVVASTGDVNDVFTKDMYLRINTIWTLRWEWLFYLCLPLVAALARFRYVTVFAIAVVLMFMDPFQITSGGTDAVFVLAFWLGALSRSLEDFSGSWLAPLFTRSGSVLALLIGIAATGYYLLGGPELAQKSVRVPVMVFTIFPVFLYFVVSKRFPDRLALPSFQLVGKVSYSFYLWHLGINYFVVRIMARLFEQPQSPTAFVLTCMAMMVIGVTVSAFTYRFVEEPFLKKSKHNTI